MRLFQILLSEPLFKDLGWVLIHSLWQGSIITLLLYLLLRSMRDYHAQARYLVACVALFLMPILPLVTFWQLSLNNNGVEIDESRLTLTQNPITNSAPKVIVTDKIAPVIASTQTSSYQQKISQGFDSALPIITCLWLLGVFYQIAQISGGLYQIHRLKQHRDELSEKWQQIADRLIEKMEIKRRVEVIASALVKVPTALGYLRPVILLPPSIFTNLSIEQLELIIAHELAHIRRHDYLINLFQTVIETILFYHPAVWYISHQIRIEREQACDDLVVATGGNPLIYARALTKVEYLRKNSTQLAMAANGGILMPRIKRLVTDSMQYRHPSSLMVGSVIFTALTMVFLCGWVIRTQAKAVTNMTVTTNSGNKESNNQNTPQSPEISADLAALIARDNLLGENVAMRQVALQALGNHTGSVVIMDPNTGKVHTIVNQEWALRRGWSPASTMKLITTMAGVTERSFDPAEKIKSAKNSSSFNLIEALAYSDNQYFNYQAGKVGAENIINYARQMGLGELTGINRDEIAGRLPRRFNNTKANYVGSYGEGIMVTPMQLSVMTAAIANGGTLVVPHIPGENEAGQYQARVRRKVNVPPATFSQLIAGMTAAVEYGTAKSAFDPNRPIAGKTGTVSSDDGNSGLFISYAPINAPKYVVVVTLKGKDVTGAKAAEIAGKIYQQLGN